MSNRADLMTIRELRAEVESLREYGARVGLSLRDESRLSLLIVELRERTRVSP